MPQRTYDVRTAALTVDADAKWVDNLLSHFDVPGCIGSRQGVQREISDAGLRAIASIRILQTDIGVSLERAVELVRDALSRRGNLESLVTARGSRIDIRVDALEAELQARLPDALEAVPRRRRGRPRKAK
jgi:hypothetical protein